MVMKRKNPSQGRQKIEIARITKRSNLQVTFSKRCAGLFKKASELCTLCAVEIAILVFSPSNKPFSFGHPSVETLINRLFFSPIPSLTSPTATQQAVYSKKASVEQDLNLQLTGIQGRLEDEKRRGEALDKMSKDSQKSGRCWWENPVEELELVKLQMLEAAMEELKNNVTEQINKMNVPVNCTPFFMMNGIQLDHHLSERKFAAETNGCHGSMIPPCSSGHGSFF